MDKEIHIRNLLYKYLANQCAEQEQDELLTHLKTPAGKWVFDEVMTSEAGKIFNSQPDAEPAVSERIFGRLQQSIGQNEEVKESTPFFRKLGLERALAFLVGLFQSAPPTTPDC